MICSRCWPSFSVISRHSVNPYINIPAALSAASVRRSTLSSRASCSHLSAVVINFSTVGSTSDRLSKYSSVSARSAASAASQPSLPSTSSHTLRRDELTSATKELLSQAHRLPTAISTVKRRTRRLAIVADLCLAAGGRSGDVQ